MRDNTKGRSGVAVVAGIIILLIIAFVIWYFLAGGRGRIHNATGSNTSTTSSTGANGNTSQNQAAENAIRANWVKFFDGSTPTDQRVKLLQNGQQFTQELQAQGQSKLASATSATVSNVQLNGKDSATVTYTIDLNGKPTLKNQQGKALLENGTWVVSDAALCQLLQLGGQTSAACPSTPGSSNGSGTSSPTAPQSQPAH